MVEVMTGIFEGVDTILVIDWPSRDVPDSLVRAGFHVVVRGGPGPEDYFVNELRNGEIVSRRLGHPPERAELVYSYRPLTELPRIVEMAKALRSKTVWTQSGLAAAGVKDPKGCWLAEDDRAAAENVVEAAGMHYVSQPYIGDVARKPRATD